MTKKILKGGGNFYFRPLFVYICMPTFSGVGDKLMALRAKTPVMPFSLCLHAAPQTFESQ